MIKSCTCKSEYQDKLYGKGMRVKNLCKKGTAVRCTICLKEDSVQVRAEIKKEKENK